ncbi:hypothetical protein [Asanoa iriomotensis]|uniref:hypothetical protein n=1 Tax=Asanoa iriomotensis TaxID=234613 RepID=UPI001942A9F7|nr:hypothetical protein [Asanoa iriomotensis]
MPLFDHAARLHDERPDAPLSRGGHPYPDDGAQPDLPTGKRPKKLRAVLDAHFADPAASVRSLHDDLTRLDLPSWTVESKLDRHRPADAERARETGRWLVRNGTDRRPVLVGLALLVATGRPEDIPVIRTIGLLDYFGTLAVRAIAAHDGAVPDLIWLAERSQRSTRDSAIAALCQRGGPDAVVWLRRNAVGGEEMSATLAREVAETVSLAEALAETDVEEQVADQAGRLLLAMVTPNDYRTQLTSYAGARHGYVGMARHAAGLPASMERLAMIVSLIDDLRTGYAAGLDWDAGEREKTLSQLRETVRQDGWQDVLRKALCSPDPLTRHRASWARAAIAAVEDRAARLQVHVVAGDPLRRGSVETRLLVDGRPVVAAAFDKGPPFAPETLLATGRLRATAEPHEVRLAEAYCTEGCCGALYVTVVREGDTVVWRDWRGHTRAEAPPEVHVDAAEYDATIAEAESDHSWEWPARTVARLLRERLTAAPGVLTRWQCHLGWVTAQGDEPLRVRLGFSYPEETFTDDEPWLQFELAIPVDETPPIAQADHIVERLRNADPKIHATVVGGRHEDAERLGYAWPT